MEEAKSTDNLLELNLCIQSILDDYKYVMNRDTEFNMAVSINQIWRWSLTGSSDNTKKQYLTQVLNALEPSCAYISVRRFCNVLNLFSKITDTEYVIHWCLDKFDKLCTHDNHFFVTNYLENYTSFYEVDRCLLTKEWDITTKSKSLTFFNCKIASDFKKDFYWKMLVWKLILQFYKSFNRLFYLEHEKAIVEKDTIRILHLYYILVLIEWHEFYDYIWNRATDVFKLQIRQSLFSEPTQNSAQVKFIKSVLSDYFSEKAIVKMIHQYLLFLPETPLLTLSS